jgi:hypothetical protein
VNVAYRFFNIPVEIRSEAPAIAAQIEALFAEFADISGEAAKLTYVVDCASDCGGHAILRDGERIRVIPEGVSAMLALEDTLMADFVREVPGMLFLHAAVLAKAGSAILFPGPSGAGKSTLSLALASRGWMYLSDEVAPVGETDLRVHPFPRGIKLRAASFELFPSLRERGGTQHADRQFLRLRELPVTLADGCFEVQSLVFPQYRPGAQPRLTPLPRAIAACILTQCCLSFDRENGGTFLTIERLVKSASCFRFEVGEIGESCEVIEAFHAGRGVANSSLQCLTN